MQTRAVLLLMVTTGVSALACSDARSGRLDAEEAPAASDATLTALSAGDTQVRLNPEPFPLRAGTTRVEIQLDPAPGPDIDVSVDLASPTMPSHGIHRFAARREGDRYEVEVPIPMEGRWMLYVNLGIGEDAAEFTFDVVPGESGPAHGPGMTHPPVHL